MRLEVLYLKNFRNYKEAAFHFHPSANRILGENGQGKTNLLEAIYFLSTGRSFRTPHLTDLIRHEENFFYIEAHFLKDGVSQSIKVTYQKNLKKLLYNGSAYSQFSQLLGILPSVLLCPSDVNLISGSPSDRRRFINLHLAQIDPLYVYHLGRYYRALKQRNALLKQKSTQAIEIWEKQLATSSLYLMKKRFEFAHRLASLSPHLLSKMSEGKDLFSIRYTPSFIIDFKEQDPIGKIADLLCKTRHKELQFSTTLIGPHRDDMAISIEKKLAKGFASEGQKRTFIATLKCVEWQLLKEIHAEPPFFGIDDFGVHLDQKRFELLQKMLDPQAQIFLTMPSDQTGFPFIEKGKTFIIKEGRLLS